MIFEFNFLNYSAPVLIVVLFVFICFTVYCFICNYILYKHSKEPIVAVRRPGLVIVSNIFAFIYIASLWLTNLYSSGCAIGYFIQHFMVFIFLSTYFLRALSLFVNFKKQFLLDKETGISAKEAKESWYFKLDRNSTLFIIFVVYNMFDVLIYIGVVTSEPDLDVFILDCKHHDISSIITLVQVLIIIILFGVFSYLMKDYKESVGIKTEFKYIAYSGILFSVVWFIFESDPFLYDIAYYPFPVSTSWLTVDIFLVVFLSTLFPVFFQNKSKQDYKRLDVDIALEPIDFKTSAIPTFQQVLSNDILAKAFREYLLMEFSIENILFIQAIDILKKNISNNNAEQTLPYREQAERILDNYVFDDSPMKVNISQEQSDKIIADVDELAKLDDNEFGKQLIERNIFTGAQQSILWMLECGSYFRWIDTEDFGKACAQSIEMV